MRSFGNSNIELIKTNDKLFTIKLSRILLWYREDFYLSKKGIPGMIYTQMLSKDSDEANLFLEFFDVNEDLEKEFEKEENGLSIWDKKMLEFVVKVKKGMKYKIEWMEYDWGTNSK